MKYPMPHLMQRQANAVRTLVATMCLALSTSLLGAEAPKAPTVDITGLPALAPGWAELNPYRGRADATMVGKAVFNQTCARCHGIDANGSRAPAPDLRRVGGHCLKLQDADLKARCQSDADVYFIKSARFGKRKFGIEHMPAWDGVLDARTLWAIRTFIENAPKPSAPPGLER
jgi:mono/diheme cytochrome c family protein